MSQVEKLNWTCWEVDAGGDDYAILSLNQMEALEQYFKENPDWAEEED